MIKRIVLSLSAFLLVFLLGFVPASAQTGSLEGTVTDSETGEVLVGATVLLTELESGASTNIDGEYIIENIPAGTHEVQFSYVGYQTITVTVDIQEGENRHDIELSLDAAGLEEVVVTGYGNFSERNFTGSISQVSSDAFEEAPVSSINEALDGHVAGVTFSPATGTPGAEQEVRIRGISSINADASPLYVIDGVPVESGNNAQSEATSSLDMLANLSASDIKSVTVLKDASSTALYGARGSNGVIVIETKSGSPGEVTYSVNIQRGVNNRAVDGPGTLNAEQWDKLFVDSYNNATGGALDYGASNWDGSTSTDWGDVVRNDDAVQQEYQISAQGGSESTNFYASTSFFEQEGQTIGSGLERFSGKLNLTHRFDDRVTFTNNFNGSFVDQDGILEGAGYFGSPVLGEFFMMPIDPAYNEDGSPNLNLSNTVFHPAYIQELDIDRKRNSRLINNSILDFQLRDNLSFTTNFSIDYLLTEEKYYNNPFYGDGEATRGSVNDINTRNFNYVWRNTLNYLIEPVEGHMFDMRVVSESQKNNNNFLDAYGEGIAAAELYNLGTTASPQDVDSSIEDWAVQSFIGLVNYRFDNKFIADGSLRYEGNSRFGEDNRWGTFWSIGLGYILSEEDFLQGVSWLDFLRIRTSYGLTGNASIDLNSYQPLVGFGGYNDQPNIQPTQLGNPDLTWEKAHSFDVSLDFEVFQAMNGSFTFFRKDGYDLLFDVPLSRTSGHESQVQNVGELYNQGLEIELGADLVRNSNFAWNVGGNFTFLKNEIKELPRDLNGDPIEITSSTRYTAVEGYEVDAWYMREWAGVDPDNGDPLWYMDDGEGGRTTTNNYNQADSYYQGANAQPTKFGGINTRIDLYGFYAQANMSLAFGYKIYDNWSSYMRSDGAGQYNAAFGQYASQADYWEEPGDNAKNPRPILGSTSNSNQNSSRFLYDGDHIRLKSLNVGYNIPTEYVQLFGLNSATVYFTGRNLWTYVFDDDLKWDPEQKADGFTDLNAQPMRSLTFGVKANF